MLNRYAWKNGKVVTELSMYELKHFENYNGVKCQSSLIKHERQGQTFEMFKHTLSINDNRCDVC